MSNLHQLKALYGKSYDSEALVTVYDIDGNPFYMIGSNGDSVSVLEGGYIITPEGTFIAIKDHQDHDAVFSYFIYRYYAGRMRFREYQSAEAAMMLNQLGFIVYFGVKMKYIPEINRMETVENYLDDDRVSKIARGYGSLSFPNDMERLTNMQRIACHLLLITNKKKNYDGEDMEYLNVVCGNIQKGLDFSKEETESILSPVVNQEVKTKKMVLY